MCGEHRLGVIRADLRQGSSPHVREALRFLVDHGYAPGIIPACAGSTIHQYVSELDGRDHPRMCGEHLPLSLITMATWGSSPHVRGARLAGDLPVDCRGIIPACAGSTYPEDDEAGFQRDHPRMCGEHSNPGTVICAVKGSSPHVRGARPESLAWRFGLGIIPACAGSTARKPFSRTFRRDHPRMCGEHERERG